MTRLSNFLLPALLAFVSTAAAQVQPIPAPPPPEGPVVLVVTHALTDMAPNSMAPVSG